MERISSFSVNHLALLPGLYVSRRDYSGNCAVTTFDVRFTAPNRQPVLDMPAVHTIEHLGATYLRNSAQGEKVVYFGPMGCRTGFYLLMFGELSPADVYGLVCGMCRFICSFRGPLPGATPQECGNYSEQNLKMAKYYTRRYLRALTAHKRFDYPL